MPLERIDRDAVRRKRRARGGARPRHSGEVRLLVGTQMLTKGHHFPDVTPGGGAERGPGPVRHGFPRQRAAGADHRAGGGPRRPRRAARARC
ncbi:MAG: hypothetical protein MZW92_13695 [Comamonadaceae bacterium]|nr:hypothetical protein [Comamonadaceae bacterium]